MNPYAVKINDKLGVKIFDVECLERLKIIKYKKSEIKKLMIDDLVNERGQGTERLSRFVREIILK